jgi:hypothetical protein
MTPAEPIALSATSTTWPWGLSTRPTRRRGSTGWRRSFAARAMSGCTRRRKRSGVRAHRLVGASGQARIRHQGANDIRKWAITAPRSRLAPRRRICGMGLVPLCCAASIERARPNATDRQIQVLPGNTGGRATNANDAEAEQGASQHHHGAAGQVGARRRRNWTHHRRLTLGDNLATTQALETLVLSTVCAEDRHVVGSSAQAEIDLRNGKATRKLQSFSAHAEIVPATAGSR